MYLNWFFFFIYLYTFFVFFFFSVLRFHFQMHFNAYYISVITNYINSVKLLSFWDFDVLSEAVLFRETRPIQLQKKKRVLHGTLALKGWVVARTISTQHLAEKK